MLQQLIDLISSGCTKSALAIRSDQGGKSHLGYLSGIKNRFDVLLEVHENEFRTESSIRAQKNKPKRLHAFFCSVYSFLVQSVAAASSDIEI